MELRHFARLDMEESVVPAAASCIKDIPGVLEVGLFQSPPSHIGDVIPALLGNRRGNITPEK